ncbi:MAG: hypothetical protein ACREF4_00605 [Gammaproteobacteria bacterium]
MKCPLVFIAAVCLLAAGCGSTSVTSERQAETKAVADEHIVVLLSRYIRQGVVEKELESVESGLEACIRAAAQRANETQAFLYPADFRRLISAKPTGTEAPGSPELVLRWLNEPAIAARLAAARVRFVVLLEASYHTSESRWGGGGGGGGFAIGKEWVQNASIQATILDLKHARIAGSINSRSSGPEGGGVGVLIIIPFPIYFTSMAESRACAAIGTALARFVSN